MRGCRALSAARSIIWGRWRGASPTWRCSSTCSPGRPPPARRACCNDDRRLVFGVPRPYFCDRIDPGVRQALERTCATLTAAGHAVRDVSVDHAAWTPDVYLHIVLPEASRFHARFLERSPSLYSPGVRVRLEMGRYLLAEDYIRALRLRTGADGRGRSDARRVRRAAAADAPDSGATARGRDGRRQRRARACARGDAAAHAALQHHRPSVRGAPGAAGRRRTATKRADRRTASPRPIGSSRSPRWWSAACSRRFARRIRE